VGAATAFPGRTRKQRSTARNKTDFPQSRKRSAAGEGNTSVINLEPFVESLGWSVYLAIARRVKIQKRIGNTIEKAGGRLKAGPPQFLAVQSADTARLFPFARR
jgi:hypothetical protein